MQRRLTVVVAALLVLGSLLMGLLAGWQGEAMAQEGPRYGGRIVVGLQGDVQGLDPHKDATYPTQIVLGHVYDQLVGFDEEFHVRPALAQSWNVLNDGKTYVFHLVQGRKFHDGSELTAEDVKFSFDRLRTASARTTDYAMIESIEVIDRYTVAFHLKEATPAFLPAVANFMLSKVVSKAHAEEQIARYGEILEPIGTGPYRLKEWIPGTRIVLERFEDHVPLPGEPGGMVGERYAYADEIVFLPITEAGSRAVAIQTGEVDMTYGIAAQDVPMFLARPHLDVQIVDGGSKALLNFDVAKPPFNDVRMRRAVALALDFDEIAEAATWGYGMVNHSFIPQFLGAWRTDVHAYRFERNLEEARRLIQEAGYDGRTITLYTSRAYPIIDTAAVMIQAQLAEVGINVAVEYVEWPALVDMWYNPDLDGNILLMVIGTRVDPHQYYYARLHTNATHNYYSNPVFDELVERAGNELDPEVRLRLYEEAQRIVLEDIPMLMLFDDVRVAVVGPRLVGFKHWATGIHRFWNVWVRE